MGSHSVGGLYRSHRVLHISYKLSGAPAKLFIFCGFQETYIFFMSLAFLIKIGLV